MAKIWSLLIFASLSVQVFSASPRFKRQKDDKLTDKYGWIIINGDNGLSPVQNATETPNGNVNSGLSLRDCVLSCPVTSEYNPVCGTNNITYPNPGRLICAQSCGVNVTLVGPNRCPNTTPPPT